MIKFCGTVIPVTGTICKWPHKDITYRVEAKIPGLTNDQIHQGFEEGIKPWHEELNINLINKSSGTVNIIVKDTKMDGVNGVLADCELPCSLPASFQLTMRFDNTDSWYYEKYVKTARHEFGHGLGLGHANKTGNIMYPSLDMKVARLGQWDIDEALARYPKRTFPLPKPIPEPWNPPGVGLPDVFSEKVYFPELYPGNTVPFRLTRHGLFAYIGSKGPWNMLDIPDKTGRNVKYVFACEKQV